VSSWSGERATDDAVSLSGIGYDSHRFAPGRPLVLAGVTIAHDQGLDGNSDADVLTHAVIDALLGAAGLGDIGQHFPDNDEQYRDADSLALLATTVTTVVASGLEIINVDITLAMERPKIGPYRDDMRAALAQTLGLPQRRVNIKATTGEGIGFVGREEGVAAIAIASLRVR
jgi:2-C-methyl-D-erythritol 2,4-cyclodiphosphate synthase